MVYYRLLLTSKCGTKILFNKRCHIIWAGYEQLLLWPETYLGSSLNDTVWYIYIYIYIAYVQKSELLRALNYTLIS